MLYKDSLPGLRPSSNWPISLDDLLERLKEMSIAGLFHQPFDLDSDFHCSAQIYIEKCLRSNEERLGTLEEEIYLGYLSKSIQALLQICLLEGSFTKIMDNLQFFEKLRQQSSILFEKAFAIAFQNIPTMLKREFIKLAEPSSFAVLQNYSIFSMFNVSKNILFTLIKPNFLPSITTDSTYLYILLNGINGGYLKVGTGQNGSIKGFVYLFKNVSFVEDNLSWVFCCKKLYMRTTITGIGCLTIIDPITFETIDQIKLLLPSSTEHTSIRTINMNYVLLSRENFLEVIVLEAHSDQSEDTIPDINQSPINKTIGLYSITLDSTTNPKKCETITYSLKSLLFNLEEHKADSLDSLFLT